MNDDTPIRPDDQDISPINIEDELKTSYLDYAMSVIVSRALPDVRDGLKPVHRRILYSMHENGFDWSKAYRKSARIVGDVIGKYHPHGDQSIYDALVRMAQSFSMRLPLVDGQGNFGSMDGDRAAAMRYTESRMAKPAGALLEDIGQDTVDFQPNYDASESEPLVLPARYPNLLVNGASGIAVGMATNIPPHSLGEVIDATLHVLENPDASVLDLMEFIPGPDFPTGASILGSAGIRSAYETGKGSIKIRSKTHIEEFRKDREAIIVTEIPFQVNKSSLVEKIAEGVRNKRIEGISDLRDESDRQGVRVVIELKRGAVADVVLNQLLRFSQLQTSFGINILALDGGKPVQMGLKHILKAFLNFREIVITRRIKFELAKARARAHVLVGLAIAVANIDEVVATIRAAANPQEARETLLERRWESETVEAFLALIDDPDEVVVDGKVRLTERQVKAILDLRLHRLTGLGREEIGDELKKLAKVIADHLETLASKEKVTEIIRQELSEVREAFADERRTVIEEIDFDDIEDEDLIRREEMVVTATQSGYVKRVPLDTYRAQRRGGKGRAGMATKDEDFLTNVFVAWTHTPVLIFTNLGKVYKLKVWKLPLATPQSKGKAIINLLQLDQDETISTILPLPEDEAEWADLNVVFATANGNIRRNLMSDFASVRANGKIAIKFEEGSDDRLIGVSLCAPDDNLLLAARGGKAIRFPVEAVRVFKGRTSMGVRGMRLEEGDRVIALCVLKGQESSVEERTEYLKAAPWKSEPNEPTLSAERMAEMEAAEEFILTATENGYGKRTSSHEFRTMGRGNRGVANIEVNERNGRVVAAFPVVEGDQVMMVTDHGKIIRTPLVDVRIMGRNTQGVTLFDVAEGESIMSVAQLHDDGDDDDEAAEAEGDAVEEETEVVEAEVTEAGE